MEAVDIPCGGRRVRLLRVYKEVITRGTDKNLKCQLQYQDDPNDKRGDAGGIVIPRRKEGQSKHITEHEYKTAQEQNMSGRQSHPALVGLKPIKDQISLVLGETVRPGPTSRETGEDTMAAKEEDGLEH